MAGNDRMILQERDRLFLRELAVMRVIDREQAEVVAGFGSANRANRRLAKLVHAGLLRRFFLGSGGGRRALYTLSEKGARAGGVSFRGLNRPQGAVLVADFFVEHQLAVNTIYCAAKFRAIPMHGVVFHRWIAFREPLASAIRLIPDGYVEFITPKGIAAAFLEVDLGNESLSIWREKTKKYLELAVSGTYRNIFGQERFRVLVAANSHRRMDSLRKAVAGITDKIFRFATLDEARTGFFGPIWRRPVAHEPEPLIEETR